jgi:hypothetical protein
VFETLDVPTTLPTLDETLAWPELAGESAQLDYFRAAARGTQVHTIHTEVEGRSRRRLFEELLNAWIADGVGFVPLEDLAREAMARRQDVPVRDLIRTTLPGRGGTVATGRQEANA